MVKILIVDDSKFMRTKIRKLLELEGHSIVGEASSGEEAIKLYASLQPDLVTMDIVMPAPGGIECLQKIRDFDPEARIIMVSAVGQDSMIIDAIKFGAKGYVIKPFKDKQVIQVVDRVLLISK